MFGPRGAWDCKKGQNVLFEHSFSLLFFNTVALFRYKARALDSYLFQRHWRGATKSLQLAEARQHGAPPRLVRLCQDYLPVGPKPCGVEAAKVGGQSVRMAHELARTEAAELVRVIEIARRAFGIVQPICSLRLVGR